MHALYHNKYVKNPRLHYQHFGHGTAKILALVALFLGMARVIFSVNGADFLKFQTCASITSHGHNLTAYLGNPACPPPRKNPVDAHVHDSECRKVFSAFEKEFYVTCKP